MSVEQKCDQCGGSHKEPFDPPLDAGIARAVKTLREGGVETFESCEGGPEHAYSCAAVRFHGDAWEGFKAYQVAMRARLPVTGLLRIWDVVDGELVGPFWEMDFDQMENCCP